MQELPDGRQGKVQDARRKKHRAADHLGVLHEGGSEGPPGDGQAESGDSGVTEGGVIVVRGSSSRSLRGFTIT